MLRLQIAWPDGRVAQFPAGGAIEKEIISDIVNRIGQEKIGLLKTKSQVMAAVESAVTESFKELKQRTAKGFQK
jgi:hypothetical protein